jgi:hypothetical protein
MEKPMSTKQRDKQEIDLKDQERRRVTDVIGKRVIDALGQPDQLHRVQVRQLWDDHYRVNVLVGLDAACAKVAHSYFLVTDSDGNIANSIPKLTKKY